MKILILGANGQVARNTTRVLLRDADAELTLYLRRASRLTNPDPARATIAQGGVLDAKALTHAMAVTTSAMQTLRATCGARQSTSSKRCTRPRCAGPGFISWLAVARQVIEIVRRRRDITS